ncbi:phosphomethylpyrimidine kinase [[Actinobacillus] muris]|uniref:hydroxymethylpyrimidine kinase n=1 Tax=Muribacter muris TaxID=67855 RepID=A0A0J5P4S9_9PAST|nr:bifunctional hydroxymethylpyrimidine kinase/phosphomethylpyrimidine kinase [Muribacter muris]KMK51281.1 phosphomethylpyrimidine kinase [[Actinobacillus] muris] [Muribacter muris]
MNKLPQVLTIAGSDSGGGAGIQADLKTFQMRRVFGTSVLTAVTAQNTQGVFDIHPIPVKSIAAQIDAVAQDFELAAVKLGMLGSREVIDCVADKLRYYQFNRIIVDPVMIAKGGAALLAPDAITALLRQLLPLTDILTPNLPEAEALTGIHITDHRTAKRAAKALQKMGANAVIIKGGHLQGEMSTDWVFHPEFELTLSTSRYDTPHTHGTGCTFSACITAELEKGKTVQQAVSIAKKFVNAAICNSLNIGKGQGPTNHWAYQDES